MKKLIKSVDVIMVRVYLLESSHLTKKIFTHLEKELKISGITLMRAVSGYGETGEHTTSLLTMSWDLPLVIEFFDREEKVKKALEYLNELVKPEHVVFWPAKANQKDGE